MRHCEVKQPMYYRILKSIRVRKRGETIIQINNEQKHHKSGKKKKEIQIQKSTCRKLIEIWSIHWRILPNI